MPAPWDPDTVQTPAGPLRYRRSRAPRTGRRRRLPPPQRSAALGPRYSPLCAQNDVAHVEAYLPVISAALAAEGIQLSEEARRALTGLEAAPPPPHPRAARLELLEALREVTTVYCAADVLAQRHVVEVVTACLQFPCPAVQQIAQHALRQWRRVALVHLRVLTGAPSPQPPAHLPTATPACTRHGYM